MAKSQFVTPVMWCLASAALFGVSTPASKWLVQELHPIMLAGLLYLGAALATVPFLATDPDASDRRDGKNRWYLGLAVLFGGIVGPGLLMIGLARTPAASVSLWLNLETTATALLAWAIFREHMNWAGWLANFLLVVAGVILAWGQGWASLAAVLAVVAACVCWGLDNNLTAVIDGFTPSQTTFSKGLVAGIFNTLIGLSLSTIPSAFAVVAALVVGALAYGASIVLYIRGAQQLGATRSQMLFSTAPFMGLVGAWVFLGEPVLLIQLAAGALVLIALGLLAMTSHDHRHVHQAQRHTHAHRHDDGHHDHQHQPTVWGWHTHEHEHEEVAHQHMHVSDLHHRHVHTEE